MREALAAGWLQRDLQSRAEKLAGDAIGKQLGPGSGPNAPPSLRSAVLLRRNFVVTAPAIIVST